MNIAKEMPIGNQGDIVQGCERMAGHKYASTMQWSVMWYSETSAGCKMAVMVGGASCWAENRSQDLVDLRSRTSREQLVGKRGKEQKEQGLAKKGREREKERVSEGGRGEEEEQGGRKKDQRTW